MLEGWEWGTARTVISRLTTLSHSLFPKRRSLSVTADGAVLFTMQAVGTVPTGTVGLAVKNTTLDARHLFVLP